MYKNFSFHFGNSTRYSQQIVEFIVNEIQKNPDVIHSIKKAIKKDNPRVIGILSFRLPPFGDPELILHELSWLHYKPLSTNTQ
ncbi:hypothetical protein [Staphylococcus auricularis]|uniref:hypothetical protein n=1 Tax=Staphylococcus auricularis TaxID=29379 RepID=UPI002D7E638D|nr:hypothetical protein [Staphylococcus auricularis]